MLRKLRVFFETHFGAPRPHEIARKELLNAQKHLLENLTHAEYYQAQVKFEQVRIQRLKTYLQLPKE